MVMTFHQDIGFQAPPPPNTMGDMNNLVNLLTGIRGIQGQNALANAYRSAVDPNTGVVDQSKLMNSLANSNAGWMTGAGGQQAGQSMEAQGRGTQAQLEAQRQQTTMLNGFLSSFDMSKPVSADQVDQKLQMAVRGGFATPSYYSQWQQMKQNMDPSELADVRPLIQAYKYVGQTAGEQADRLLGLPVGEQAKVQQWLQQPYTWNDSTTGGVPYTGTYGEWLQRHNVPPNQFFPGGAGVPPTQGGQGAQGTGGGTSIGGVTTGRQPVTGGRAGAGGTVPAAGPTNVGTSTEAYDPGVLKAGIDSYNADAQLQGSLGTRLYPVTSAISLLHSDPSLATGPGQQSFARVVTGISQTLGLPVPIQASNFQELSKYLAQYMRNLPGANRSDLAALDAEASSPNPTQSRPAIEQLLARAIGFERIRGAQYDYFNQQFSSPMEAGLHAGTYAMRVTGWKGQQDPVAWSVDYMTPQQVASYFNGLSGTVKPDGTATGDKGRFVNSLRAARQVGGIEANRSAAAPPPPIFKPAPNEQRPAPPPAAAPAVPPRAAPVNPNVPAPPPPGSVMTPQQMYGG